MGNSLSQNYVAASALYLRLYQTKMRYLHAAAERIFVRYKFASLWIWSLLAYLIIPIEIFN